MDTSITKDLQIKGSNLCNMECVDKNSIIYPQTHVTQILTDNSNNQNLYDWVTYDPDDPEHPHENFSGSLTEWLRTYYSSSVVYTLPTAAPNKKGGIKVKEDVTINNVSTPTYLIMHDDYLMVDKDSLNIPPNYNPATFDELGLIYLGNNTKLPEDFSEDPIEDPEGYCQYPLRVDAKGHTGILIAKGDFGNIPSDWNATSGNPGYIYNKPTIPTVNNSTITIQQGGITKGNFTLNQNTNKIIVLDSTGNTIDSTYNIKVSDVVDVIGAVDNDMEQFKKCFIELFSGEFEAIGNGKKTINVNLLGNFNFNNTYGEGHYNERDFLAAIIEVLGQLIYDNKTYFENYLHLNINVSFNIINPLAHDTINISLADLIENSNLKEISYTGDYSATYDTIDEQKYVCLEYDDGKKHFFTIKYFNTAVRHNDGQLINDDYEYSTLLVQYTTSTETNIL